MNSPSYFHSSANCASPLATVSSSPSLSAYSVKRTNVLRTRSIPTSVRSKPRPAACSLMLKRPLP
jgi:hypothetical protein